LLIIRVAAVLDYAPETGAGEFEVLFASAIDGHAPSHIGPGEKPDLYFIYYD
jgi:hypothetical protein